MPFSFGQLQTESKAWVEHNFGKRPLHQPLLGLAEEYGELLAAEKIVDIQDAVADIVIFLTDFCNACNIDMDLLNINEDTFSYTTTISQLEREMGVLIGKLNHHYLKREQGIRGTATFHELQIAIKVQKLLSVMQIYSKLCGFDFLKTVEQTWAKVSKRDWAAQRSRAVAGVIPNQIVSTEEVKRLDEYATYKIYR